ncbi:MAG: transglycosylase SLT domain-containing protein [Bdellovibrionota bacterium]
MKLRLDQHMKKLLLISLGFVSILGFFGCATGPTRGSDPSSGEFSRKDALLKVEDLLKADAKIEVEDLPLDENEKANLISEVTRKSRRNIPIEINEQVEDWIAFFTTRGRERFNRYLSRGSEYRETVVRILRENRIPEDLYYLALIESGFVVNARSHQQAVGMWQFIRPTARRYGLRVNRHIDDRKDPIRSTKAAARYLKDLHGMFGSWHLAMAAYNAGEGRIMGAIRKGKTRDFWTLVERGVLPKETMHYVPKFLAALIIGENPRKYGFDPVDRRDYPRLAEVRVPASVRFSDLARVTSVSYAELKKLNPHYARAATPRSPASSKIWVPQTNLKEFSYKKLKRLRSSEPAREVAIHSANAGYGVNKKSSYHRVRRGENLRMIAERYKVSVKKLKRANRLGSSMLQAGQYLKVPQRSI